MAAAAIAAFANSFGSTPFFRMTTLCPMACFGIVPMFVKVSFTSWPALTSKLVWLNFMLSLAVSSMTATAGAAGAAAAGAGAPVGAAAVDSSFLPQAARTKAPTTRGKMRDFFMVRQ